MKDSELQFDRTCHVLYSRPCKKQIREKIALHYPPEHREEVWEQVQRQYVDFLRDWRTDLGGRKNFHNSTGGNYDCIALMAYYAVCKSVTSLAEIEEMEGELFLPAFRRLRFVDANRPFVKRLMYLAFLNAKKQCDKWGDFKMYVAPYDKDKPLYIRIHRLSHGGICQTARAARGHAGALQSGLCRHGADPRAPRAHHHLRQRLQMRLRHLRRP